MATVKARFDSAERHFCDYCGGEVSADMVVEGIPGPGNGVLFVYHPECDQRLSRSETLADYIELINFMNRTEVL